MTLTVEIRWDEKAGLRRDAVRSQVIDVLKAQIKRRPAMKKVSTAAVTATKNFSQPKLTIGLDLGDRWSWYCVLDEAGTIVLEQKLSTHHCRGAKAGRLAPSPLDERRCLPTVAP